MIWGLRSCPCCGAPADVVYSTTEEHCIIACSKKGCRLVEARSDTDAAKIWNEVRFTDPK